MNRPEPIELENNLGPDVTGEINRVPWMAYDVDEMDIYIAAKDAEVQRLKHAIAELKQKLEDVQASHYAEMVDAGVRERRLRRALWIARAERAIAEAEYWYGHCAGMYYIDATDVPDEEDNPYKRVKDTTIGWYKTWMNIERKCRAKAEEYK